MSRVRKQKRPGVQPNINRTRNGSGIELCAAPHSLLRLCAQMIRPPYEDTCRALWRRKCKPNAIDKRLKSAHHRVLSSPRQQDYGDRKGAAKWAISHAEGGGWSIPSSGPDQPGSVTNRLCILTLACTPLRYPCASRQPVTYWHDAGSSRASLKMPRPTFGIRH